jgi:N6-adenosine-specific RNA methylase IME4
VNTVLGLAAAASGAALIALSAAAQRYHSRRFREHFEAIERLAGEDSDALSREIERFHEDRTVDRSVGLMALGYPVGFVLLAGGLLWAALG